MAENNANKSMSRRRFIKNSSYAAGGIIGGGFLGTILGRNLNGGGGAPGTTTDNPVPGDSGATDNPNFNQAMMFFSSQQDFNILSQATERIFPEDDNGPGAIKLGVPFFIDHQLAAAYGNNDREYMQGPFYEGAESQGYQTRLKRKELFLQGIHAIQSQSQSEFNTSFTELDASQQDEILTMFQNNEISMNGVQSAFFFEQLRSATIAGAYADPLYGGNFNMEGWKMKQYPGHQPSYLNQIGDAEEFIEVEPMALRANLSSST